MNDYWDIIWEIIREIDNSSDNNDNIYVDVYPYGEDKQILVFGDTKSEENFGMKLKAKLENISEIKQAVEDVIYDVSERSEWWIEQAVGDSEYWTYSDEGYVCQECYKWKYYDYYGATEYANYQAGDGWIICEDCIKADKDRMENYIKDMIDNPKHANTILDYKELLDLGFDKVNNDYPYANGMYGQVDSPKKILEKAKAEDANKEYLFSIRKNYNPFECEFDLYAREIG